MIKWEKKFFVCGYNFFKKCYNDNKSFVKIKNVLLLLIVGNNWLVF